MPGVKTRLRDAEISVFYGYGETKIVADAIFPVSTTRLGLKLGQNRQAIGWVGRYAQ